MTPIEIGMAGIASMFGLLLFRVPIGVALSLVGVAGIIALQGAAQGVVQLQLVIWELGTDFLFIALPLFILMGQLAHQTGMAERMYRSLHYWFGRQPGGLAVTAIIGASGMGAITGSSLVTVSAMGNMAIPPMKKRGYAPSLAAGSIAASGVLAILIPPSIPLVFYGVWTETSIGELFIAGILPGCLLALTFSLYVLIHCFFNQTLGPAGESVGLRERLSSLPGLLPFIGVFLVVLGSIYSGFASPTEAAAIGVFAVLLIALGLRQLRWKAFIEASSQSVLLSSNVFLILVGGMIFSRFMAQTGLVEWLVTFVVDWQLSYFELMLMLVLMYLVLGAFFDIFGMMILSLPFVFPVVLAMGVDRVWFGIFLVMMIELALITPPIGMNVFMIQRVVPEVPLPQIFWGAFPFVCLSLLVVLLLVCYPDIALWLPSTMY